MTEEEQIQAVVAVLAQIDPTDDWGDQPLEGIAREIVWSLSLGDRISYAVRELAQWHIADTNWRTIPFPPYSDVVQIVLNAAAVYDSMRAFETPETTSDNGVPENTAETRNTTSPPDTETPLPVPTTQAEFNAYAIEIVTRCRSAFLWLAERQGRVIGKKDATVITNRAVLCGLLLEIAAPGSQFNPYVPATDPQPVAQPATQPDSQATKTEG